MNLSNSSYASSWILPASICYLCFCVGPLLCLVLYNSHIVWELALCLSVHNVPACDNHDLCITFAHCKASKCFICSQITDRTSLFTSWYALVVFYLSTEYPIFFIDGWFWRSPSGLSLGWTCCNSIMTCIWDCFSFQCYQISFHVWTCSCTSRDRILGESTRLLLTH